MSQKAKGPGKLAREKSTLDNTLIKIEEGRQRDFVKNILHPYMLEHSNNIKDAGEMLYICQTALEGAFNRKILAYQIQCSAEPTNTVDYMDGLKTVIQDKDERSRLEGLMKLFENEKISMTSSNLAGMKKAYESFEVEEMHNRSLSTLKTDFL